MPERGRGHQCPSRGQQQLLREADLAAEASLQLKPRFSTLAGTMARNRAKSKRGDHAPSQRRLPKNALQRVNLGKSFAEYDTLLSDQSVFVRTPPIEAALDPALACCFFVGRRGTGKTAITLFLEQKVPNALLLLPRLFAPDQERFAAAAYRDTRQRPFRSLVEAFQRALLTEAVSNWLRLSLIGRESLPDEVNQYRSLIEQHAFDSRLLLYMEEILRPLAEKRDRPWLKQIGRSKDLAHCMDTEFSNPKFRTVLLIDRIDEAWDGSDRAVAFLMAMMHACVELTAYSDVVRPLLFVRENIFERVRQLDNEFARLETSVVSLDWSPELLRELVERRLIRPFTTKLALHGETWDYFFDQVDNRSSINFVCEYCQHRPRDVLVYCRFAVENAVAACKDKVEVDNLLAAKRRFSDSRLKDLGDEYAENYPNISLVLSRFFGLGRVFTYDGILSFIRKLLVDDEIKVACKAWVFSNTVPERFIEVLYTIGFVGIADDDRNVKFRSMGARSTSAPKVTPRTSVHVHPSYWEALELHDVVVTTLDDLAQLKTGGLVEELPRGATLEEYHSHLKQLQDNLATIPIGKDCSDKFEDIVGEVLRLCFFRYFTNVEPQVRDVDGTQIRDWVCANSAPGGFWEMIRQRYDATQVVWECKNYQDLRADDFQQAAYRISPAVGRCVVIAYRGDTKNHYYAHIGKIASDRDGIVLLAGQRDLEVFIRQAINGKTRDSHIREIYDQIVRRL